MKTMDEYTAELDRRIDEKTALLGARRRRLTVVCACLALCLCAVGVWRIIEGRRGGLKPVPGLEAELPLERNDRFVMGKEGYRLSEGSDKESERVAYTGLMAFQRENDIAFTFVENGPIYTVKNESVGYIMGALPVGAWYGAAYYRGGVYMPATDEVVCGLVRSHGVCRWDPETGRTECAIVCDDTASSVLITGDLLVYATSGEKTAVIKLCDLTSGKIYRLAELIRTPGEAETYGWYNYSEARVILCGDGLAAVYGGKAYTVSFDGQVKLIAERAWDISADGDRLFVFGELENDWGDMYAGGFDIMRRTAQSVAVYSAKSGEKLAELDLGGLSLACCSHGRFTVYKGCLVAVRDGWLLLVDPVGGGEEKLAAGMPQKASAAVVADRLLVLYNAGFEELDYFGDILLIDRDGAAFGSKLPMGLSSRRDEKLTFKDFDSAQSSLFYETADIPFAFEKLENADIYGTGSVFTSYIYGERNEKHMGFITVDAEYRGKAIHVTVSQEERDRETSFALKLGLGTMFEEELFSAESLPTAQTNSDGTLYKDLILKDGEPIGIMMWFDDTEGSLVDIEARLLCESAACRTLVCIISDELTAQEIRELIKAERS